MSAPIASELQYASPVDTEQWEQELLAQASCHHLFRSRPIDLSATRGVVILQGEVHSYYEKQLAQEVVRRIVGVERVENQIEVEYS
jgi:osmotically-inducible protein OsmY